MDAHVSGFFSSLSISASLQRSYLHSHSFPSRGGARALTLVSTQQKQRPEPKGPHHDPRSHNPSRLRSNSTASSNLNLRWSRSTALRAPRPSPRSRSDSLSLESWGSRLLHLSKIATTNRRQSTPLDCPLRACAIPRSTFGNRGSTCSPASQHRGMILPVLPVSGPF